MAGTWVFETYCCGLKACFVFTFSQFPSPLTIIGRCLFKLMPLIGSSTLWKETWQTKSRIGWLFVFCPIVSNTLKNPPWVSIETCNCRAAIYVTKECQNIHVFYSTVLNKWHLTYLLFLKPGGPYPTRRTFWPFYYQNQFIIHGFWCNLRKKF